MLVLFESAVGLCLFKLKDGKLSEKGLHKEFEDPEKASNLSVLFQFSLPARVQR